MDVCPDYEDLFKAFNEHKIRYLVVGGQAVIFYSEPRYTKDMDVWVPPELNDAETVYKALKKFGAPLTRVKPKDFTNKKIHYQIGVAPVRIDIMTHVSGTAPIRAWKTKRRSRYGKTPISVIDIQELIQTKRAAGRPQDIIDLAKLQDRARRFHKKLRRTTGFRLKAMRGLR